jgi:hypothetical protein
MDSSAGPAIVQKHLGLTRYSDVNQSLKRVQLVTFEGP